MMRRALAACVVAALLASGGPARAADLGVPPAREAVRPAAAGDHLRRLAVLLMIRATFDVIAPEEIEGALVREAERLGAAGPGDADAAALDRDLLAEGSYYLVSLKYLAGTGGAVWPEDRPEAAYVNDVLVRLEALERRLVDAIAERADPLPVLVEAQRILGWTEGIARLPAEFDRFAGRDALVERVLAAHGPRAGT